jgi:HD-GYP domain-containing protein (c-di-GMP phosphodiesterase class II)
VEPSRSQLSIVAQSLDRAAFVAYFLGAIVPYVALAWLLQGWVLPAVSDGLARAGLLALALSLGVLSAAAFLLLRRVTRRTLAETRADNARLAVLLDSSARLGGEASAGEVATAAAVAAQRLADAAGAFVVALQPGSEPKLEAAAGDRALFAAVEARLGELADVAEHAAQPILWRNGTGSGALFPIAGIGALAVVTPARRLAPAVTSALAMLATQASVALRRVQLVDAQRNFFVYVTDLLVAALDTHMDMQAGHARRVAQLSNRLGRDLGLDEASRQRLHFAALLHDVGMLRIDPARLADPRTARQHPQLGHRMLAPIQLWAEVAPLVLHHHEWWDGNGYPERLAGDAIPFESRIIAVAEAFDSMTSQSSYQETVPRDEAVHRIESAAGTQFDPEVVRVFLALARRGDVDLA